MNILLCGCNGRMGKAVAAACGGEDKIVAGIDVTDANASFPVYKSIFEVREKADVIVDFSHHTLVYDILSYSKEKEIPAVICTTGHTDEEKEYMSRMDKETAVFTSGNMSLGINLLCSLAKQAAEILGDDYDVEIIEAHHHNKLDAPSGTALMIAEEIESALPYEADRVFDRTPYRKKREKNEIGIHSIRGGSIVGEHEVMFCGGGEVITVKHSALSRDLFAQGAVKAARYMVGKKVGRYSMKDVLKNAGEKAESVL
jgi:4-hydroxy-tetrahydrodipicolinate reductase